MTAGSTVGVVVFAGFEELDALGPYDVFQTAGREGAPVTAECLSLDGADQVTASKGLHVEPHGQLPDDPTADGAPDYLVVPGGGWNAKADVGAWAEAERGRLPELAASYRNHGTTVASVCTGAMVLERAGLLADRPAVTHGDAMAELRASDANVVDARVVDDGDVVTAGGVTAGLDVALWLVEREWGENAVSRVESSLECERTDDVHVAE